MISDQAISSKVLTFGKKSLHLCLLLVQSNKNVNINTGMTFTREKALDGRVGERERTKCLSKADCLTCQLAN